MALRHCSRAWSLSGLLLSAAGISGALAPVTASVAAPSAAAESQALSLDPELPDSAEDLVQGRPTAAPADAGVSRAYVELGRGQAELRTGNRQGLWRATLDARLERQIQPRLQGTLSARVDHASPEDPRLDGPVLTLREVAVAWQDTGRLWTLQAGRVNLREGPAYGYNPTDFLKGRTLRTITTANPSSLRESRLGTVMVRAQRLGDGGSWSVLLAPRLASGTSGRGLAVDLGATNDRQRLVLAQGRRWGPALSTRALLLSEEGSPPQLGGSASALLGEATVAHLEWAGGRSRSLQAIALHGASDERWRHRWAAGATHTFGSGLSFTGEWHHNGAALDRAGWQALRSQAPLGAVAYFAAAASRQDNASRDAVFFYASQRDLLVRGVDLSALLKLNRDDRSRFAWLELRRRFERLDLFLQWQRALGQTGSEFGSLPFRHSWGLFMSAYL
jgi:hypothetical protein